MDDDQEKQKLAKVVSHVKKVHGLFDQVGADIDKLKKRVEFSSCESLSDLQTFGDNCSAETATIEYSTFAENLAPRFWSPTPKRKKYKTSHSRTSTNHLSLSKVHSTENSSIYLGCGEPCPVINRAESSILPRGRDKMKCKSDVASSNLIQFQTSKTLLSSDKTPEPKLNHSHNSWLKPSSSSMNLYCLTKSDASTYCSSPDKQHQVIDLRRSATDFSEQTNPSRTETPDFSQTSSFSVVKTSKASVTKPETTKTNIDEKSPSNNCSVFHTSGHATSSWLQETEATNFGIPPPREGLDDGESEEFLLNSVSPFVFSSLKEIPLFSIDDCPGLKTACTLIDTANSGSKSEAKFLPKHGKSLKSKLCDKKLERKIPRFNSLPYSKLNPRRKTGYRAKSPGKFLKSFRKKVSSYNLKTNLQPHHSDDQPTDGLGDVLPNPKFSEQSGSVGFSCLSTTNRENDTVGFELVQHSLNQSKLNIKDKPINHSTPVLLSSFLAAGDFKKKMGKARYSKFTLHKISKSDSSSSLASLTTSAEELAPMKAEIANDNPTTYKTKQTNSFRKDVFAKAETKSSSYRDSKNVFFKLEQNLKELNSKEPNSVSDNKTHQSITKYCEKFDIHNKQNQTSLPANSGEQIGKLPAHLVGLYSEQLRGNNNDDLTKEAIQQTENTSREISFLKKKNHSALPYPANEANLTAAKKTVQEKKALDTSEEVSRVCISKIVDSLKLSHSDTSLAIRRPRVAVPIRKTSSTIKHLISEFENKSNMILSPEKSDFIYNFINSFVDSIIQKEYKKLTFELPACNDNKEKSSTFSTFKKLQKPKAKLACLIDTNWKYLENMLSSLKGKFRTVNHNCREILQNRIQFSRHLSSTSTGENKLALVPKADSDSRMLQAKTLFRRCTTDFAAMARFAGHQSSKSLLKLIFDVFYNLAVTVASFVLIWVWLQMWSDDNLDQNLTSVNGFVSFSRTVSHRNVQ